MSGLGQDWMASVLSGSSIFFGPASGVGSAVQAAAGRFGIGQAGLVAPTQGNSGLIGIDIGRFAVSEAGGDM